MKHNLVICRFSEQRYMILNLCTFFGTPGRGVNNIQQAQPCVESFSNTALCNPSGQSLTYRGNFSKHPNAPETGSPAYTRTSLAQSSDL